MFLKKKLRGPAPVWHPPARPPGRRLAIPRALPIIARHARIPTSPANRPLRLKRRRARAPMAGYTDRPFRQPLRAVTPQAFLAYSEMVEPLQHPARRRPETPGLAGARPGRRPACLAAFTHRPGTDGRGGPMVGSPARGGSAGYQHGLPQAQQQGAGAGLLQSPAPALAIARRVAAAVRVPVTAKLRLLEHG